MDAGLRSIRTTCPYCGVGCGVIADVSADGSVAVRGDPDHPANFGRLCSKGSALADVLVEEGRLLHPEIDGKRASWDDALDLVACRFSEAIAAHGPDSVAFYVSGQLLTEDYYVANKLMKGFIGSANIDTNSRLCMASAVSGHRRAFGADTVPCSYEDLEAADLVVLVGSNLAWCHPVLFQRLIAAREERGTTIVVLDPRRTATAESADLHVALAPGSDVALFNGLLNHLWVSGTADLGFIDGCTSGLDHALKVAEAVSFAEVATATGLAASDLERFYDLFARSDRVVTVFSQGVNQSADGTDKVNAIVNCHLLTGRIGKRGAGPFSVTGQPNAMGGREVGGLANQLAAHMAIEEPSDRDRVRRFWRARRVADEPGLKAVDLFRAVADGRIKALWIMATNPVDSMPEADRVRDALIRCPFVVVSDVTRNTDTARHADVLLPAAAWGEKDGTVTNSERRISRQRAFRRPAGEARPDWRIVADVARRMGHADAFGYDSPAAIFREHAALSAFENHGSRDFDLSGLVGIDDRSYDRLAPVRWPVRADAPTPMFGDGRFFTPDGRARFIATPPVRPEARAPAFPLVLNTGRTRDHWHTMTRTGLSPRLSVHAPEPYVELHPCDAAARHIPPDTLVEVRSAHGRMTGRAKITDSLRPGSIFAPMHWTDQSASGARVDVLVDARTDPVSGQPALKSARVEVRAFEAAWHGFAVVCSRPGMISADYWALARVSGGWRLELAGVAMPEDWTEFARALLPGAGDGLLAYHDAANHRHRFAAFDGERLTGALFVSPEPPAIGRTFLADGLAVSHPTAAERLRLLAGQPGVDRPDPGGTVCSCFAVGVNQIAAAVVSGRCMSVEAVGALLQAGTNCGSCRPEIRRIIREYTVKEAV
ncbi:MAG TPA: nitrate reductase [Bauldia sp.]|nr:nitrate reductase [Bauldia sp.]